ncbi:TLDc domain-containing protein [Entamoeba marina]
MLEVVNNAEDEVKKNIYDKYDLEKYERVVEGNDEDILQKYNEMYKEIKAIVIKKNNAIKKGGSTIEKLQEIEAILESIKKETSTYGLNLIRNKEIQNTNQIIQCLNQLVDKILEKEVYMFNKKEEEFEQQKQQRKQEFEEKQNDINNMKYTFLINPVEVPKVDIGDDVELHKLNYSIDSLKKWSGKQNYNIIFDSKVQGDGKGVLEHIILNKRNLYFISFDDQNNIFGGYLKKSIKKMDSYVRDSKSFVFSLQRNGHVKNKKFPIIKNYEDYAFYMSSNINDCLYCFGGSDYSSDIYAWKIGYKYSFCDYNYYNYRGESYPLRDDTDYFTIKRFVVLEMI